MLQLKNSHTNHKKSKLFHNGTFSYFFLIFSSYFIDYILQINYLPQNCIHSFLPRIMKEDSSYVFAEGQIILWAGITYTLYESLSLTVEGFLSTIFLVPSP